MYSRPLILCALLLACQTTHAQEPIYNHLYWDAKGTAWPQFFGYNGLSYLGKLSETVTHAVAIGEFEKARLIFNQGIRDTTPQYYFPGNKVWRCSMNGDSFPDFVCFSPSRRRITVLFGTSDPTTFDTALVLQGDINRDEFSQVSMIVGRCDSDAYDDIVLVDGLYADTIGGKQIGRMLYFKGGPTMQTIPTAEILGTFNQKLTGTLVAGYIHGGTTMQMLRLPGGGRPLDMPQQVLEYQMGTPVFRLVPSDTLKLNVQGSGLATGIAIINAYDDSTADIALGTVSAVLIYRGGGFIADTPAFAFHRPFETSSTQWGSDIVDVGNITGRGYSTLLVTDPDASLGNQENGAIFLYNIGKGLKDKCVGYARGNEFAGKFGTSVIAIGDVNNDSKNDFMVGGDAYGKTDHAGYVAVFLGDTIYGPTTAVREIGVTPTVISLAQNYPNPCSVNTIVTFDIAGEREVKLNVCDAVGRVVTTVISERVNTGRYAANIITQNLSNGTYRYDLTDGNSHISKIMTVVK